MGDDGEERDAERLDLVAGAGVDALIVGIAVSAAVFAVIPMTCRPTLSI